MVNWENVKEAVQTVAEGKANRLDGDGYKVYKVGTVIRVDISEKKE